ncbi:hypothetical protein [Vibrio owensii]|uniref:hypothetical protein n=1 Tax=Vibrio owensii TaxID=696485 RepID=UPI0018F1DE70|nr:hypothetical protein [Vibrio owensii]
MRNPIQHPLLSGGLSIIPILSQKDADRETEMMQHAVKHYFEWTEKGKSGSENTFFFRLVPVTEPIVPSDCSTIAFQFDVTTQSFSVVSHVSYRNAQPCDVHKKAALTLLDKLEGLIVYQNKKVELLGSSGGWGIVLDGPDERGYFLVAFAGNSKKTTKAKREEFVILRS